jgi:hypothetical protein
MIKVELLRKGKNKQPAYIILFSLHVNRAGVGVGGGDLEVSIKRCASVPKVAGSSSSSGGSKSTFRSDLQLYCEK